MTRVYSAPSSISGLGLFASEDFSKGDEVISFKAKTTSKFEWRDKCLSLPIPEDAAFVFNGKMLYDPKFVPNQAIPMWYYFNHSSNPNTRMRRQGADRSYGRLVRDPLNSKQRGANLRLWRTRPVMELNARGWLQL